MKYQAAILALLAVLSHSPAALAGQSSVRGEPIDLIALFRAVGAMYQLDPGLLSAIAAAESNNDAGAVSRKGALGLMQLMPATAGQFNVADPLDPVDNALGAARFLDYLRRYRACRDLPQLLAAYNAGVGAVEHYKGVPPYPETREYVRRVLLLYLLAPEMTVQSPDDVDMTDKLLPKNSIKRHPAVRGDQVVLDQLADLMRQRAAVVRAH